MQQKKLAFIGAGNMSRSIISGLIKSGTQKKTSCGKPFHTKVRRRR